MASNTSTPPNRPSIGVRNTSGRANNLVNTPEVPQTPSRTNNLINTPDGPETPGTPSTPSYCSGPPPVVDDKVARCMEILGYDFNNPFLLVEALNMSGSPLEYNGRVYTIRKNQIFAVHGDGIMRPALSRQFCMKDLPTAKWTKIFDDVLSNASLAVVGFGLELDKCIRFSRMTPKVSMNMMATTMEAIFGAIELDGGAEAVDKTMERLGFGHELLEGKGNLGSEAVYAETRNNTRGRVWLTGIAMGVILCLVASRVVVGQS
jgi:hypothetical protein